VLPQKNQIIEIKETGVQMTISFNLNFTNMKTTVLIILIFLSFIDMNVNGQNLLADGNFEASKPWGNWPTSGAWQKAWYPYDAGAVTTSTAAKNGKCGLWIYTSGGNSFSRPYQEFKCNPLARYKAEAWLRSPWNQSWTKETTAFLQLKFLDKAGRVINSVSSDTLHSGNAEWKLYSVEETAPYNAVNIRFSINLESKTGQSILNADNSVVSEYKELN
jgi:hypothetical protein